MLVGHKLRDSRFEDEKMRRQPFCSQPIGFWLFGCSGRWGIGPDGHVSGLGLRQTWFGIVHDTSSSM